jgi:hypothetical protein
MLAQEHFGASADREQRVTQVVAEHGNELFAQLGGFALLQQRGFGELRVFLGFDLQRKHPRERLHGALDAAGLELCRVRIEGADRAEKARPSVRNTGTEI